MKTISRSIAAGSLFAVFALAQPPNYSVTDLGPMGPNGQPFVVTNNGLISEGVAVSSGAYHAILWYRGLATDISAGGLGGPNSQAIGVNLRAQVIGQAETSELDPYNEDFCGYGTHLICLPFIWQFGLMTPLPTLGGKSGTALMINSRGQVAGYAENATQDQTCKAPQVYQFEPVLWTNGSAQALPTFPGDLEGVAWAVNDNGQAAGGSGFCTGLGLSGNYLQSLHALLWDNGRMTDLGNLGGTGHGFGISAKNMNNQGQVIGESDVPGDQTFHAFLWSKATGMKDLGTLPGDVSSWALGINDAGVVTGVSFDAQFNPRAFILQDGVMSDLNALIPADSPWLLWTACSITPRGEIVGISSNKTTGEIHGYLAIPR